MINKLRRRIILINMLLIGTVILAIFITVIYNNYASSVNMMDRGMNQVFDKLGRDFDDRPEHFSDELFDPENFGEQNDTAEDATQTETATASQSESAASSTDSTRDDPSQKKDNRGFKHNFGDETPIQISSYVIVNTDEDGAITKKQENELSIDSETLAQCIKTALSGKAGFGQINEYGLMYAVRAKPHGNTLVFASSSSIYTSLTNSIIICSLLFLGSMAVIFVISLLLSGLAVKPVKSAWEQQKQFVADASHELKTPLTVILANNNIMMSHKDSTVADERQWLESTEEEAKHMKKLIDNMLFLAKSDAGTAKVQFSEVNFSEIAEGCALNFEPVAFEKDILIDAEHIAPDVLLSGDATQLNQLAHILVDNAVKYASAGTTVTIRLERRGDRAEFSVNNYGSVIPKEDCEHVFDRFYRAEKSRTTKGYGLGLAIAKRIVTDMNGKISVVSSEAEGTTFTVKCTALNTPKSC